MTEEDVPANEANLLSSLVSSLPGMAYRCENSPERRMAFVSDAVQALTGYNRAALTGKQGIPYQRLIHPQDRPRVQEEILAAVREGRPFELTYRIHTASGQEKWVWDQGRAVPDFQGKPAFLEGLVLDISLRTASKERLQQQAANRQKVAQALRDILTVLNSKRTFKEILDYIVFQARQLLGAAAGVIYRGTQTGDVVIDAASGAPAELLELGNLPFYLEAVNRAIYDRKPFAVSSLDPYVSTDLPGGVESLDSTLTRWKEIIRSNYRAYLVVPLVIKDDLYGALALYYTQPRQFSDDDIQLGMALGDQVALAIENARLREQLEQSAVVAERNRLARELHDAVTQSLFSASLIAEVLPKIWNHKPEEGRRRLEELRQLTRGALAEMRTLLLELRPSSLAEADIEELFQHLAEAFTGRARIPVHTQFKGQAQLSPEVKVALYRIAQESLNNIAKHANAETVSLEILCQPDQTTLIIRDDGCGFDPDDLASENLGLGIMHERAQQIGADLNISSQPGQGTQVTVHLSTDSQ
ncbi:MAG: PAS domain-containing protein [Anaerolineales bacterium]